MDAPSKIRLLAPAKVNLFIRVSGRRPDGMHQLESLIIPVSLYDRLEIDVGLSASCPEGQITVECDHDDVPSGAENLAHRAAVVFFEAIQQPPHGRIRMQKSIPVGGGLGGGSSNAASVLLGLNWLLGRPFGIEYLASLAGKLGADVPVFVYGWSARVTGIGDIVAPIRLPGTLHMVVCSDGCLLSTKSVFARLRLPLTTESLPSNIAGFVRGRIAARDFLTNDLEEAAGQVHPEISSLKRTLLRAGAEGAVMTGSGSAVVGLFSGLRAAHAAAQKLSAEGLWARAVQSLPSPAMVGS